MPLINDLCFTQINDCLENKNYLVAINHLESIISNPDSPVLFKLNACKLLVETYRTLIIHAKTEEETINYSSAKIEALGMLEYYQFMSSPEYENAIRYENLPTTEPLENQLPQITSIKKITAQEKKKNKAKLKKRMDKWFSLADEFHVNDKFDEALEQYKKIITDDPKYWPAYVGCIDIYLRKNELDTLISNCHFILANLPADYVYKKDTEYTCYIYLYEAYFNKKEFDVAIDCLAKANEIKQNEIDTLLCYAKSFHIQMKNHIISVQLTAESVSINENAENRNAREHFGIQACDYYEKALDLLSDEKRTASLLILGEIYILTNHMLKAKQCYLKIGELREDRQYMSQLKSAQITFQSQQFEESLHEFHQLMQQSNFNSLDDHFKSEILLNCGVACEKLDRYNQAVDYFEDALKHNPRSLVAQLSIERLLKSRLLSTPSTIAIIDVSSHVSLESISNMQDFINMPSTPTIIKAYILGLCGQVYAKLNNLDNALTCYELATNIMPPSRMEQDIMNKLARLKDMRKMASLLIKETIFKAPNSTINHVETGLLSENVNTI